VSCSKRERIQKPQEHQHKTQLGLSLSDPHAISNRMNHSNPSNSSSIPPTNALDDSVHRRLGTIKEHVMGIRNDPIHELVDSGDPVFIGGEMKTRQFKFSRNKDKAASALEEHIQEIASLGAHTDTEREKMNELKDKIDDREEEMLGIRADAEDRIAQLQALIQQETTIANEDLQRVWEEKDSLAHELENAIVYVATIEKKRQKAESEVEKLQQDAEDERQKSNEWTAIFTESNKLQGNSFSNCPSARCGECQ